MATNEKAAQSRGFFVGIRVAGLSRDVDYFMR